MSEYADIINNAKSNSQKSLNDVSFDVGNVRHDDSYDVNKIATPQDVGHSYTTKNYYDQLNSYNDLAKKTNEYSFENPFNKAMEKDVGSNIEGMKATNAALKNSKGNVNELVPELMSKVSDNVNDTIDNITNFFQGKLDSMQMQDINNYAKISDILAQKSGIDVQTEQDLLKQWSINKEMEYSLEGLKLEKEAAKEQQFYNQLQTGIQTVGTIAACVALFL